MAPPNIILHKRPEIGRSSGVVIGKPATPWPLRDRATFSI
jgi:hypothetical protein